MLSISQNTGKIVLNIKVDFYRYFNLLHALKYQHISK